MCHGWYDALTGAKRAKILPGGLQQINPTTEPDLGTPASPVEETVTIEIDGLPATVKAGSTIMFSL
jgi:hypothetical protein